MRGLPRDQHLSFAPPLGLAWPRVISTRQTKIPFLQGEWGNSLTASALPAEEGLAVGLAWGDLPRLLPASTQGISQFWPWREGGRESPFFLGAGVRVGVGGQESNHLAAKAFPGQKSPRAGAASLIPACAALLGRATSRTAPTLC